VVELGVEDRLRRGQMKGALGLQKEPSHLSESPAVWGLGYQRSASSQRVPLFSLSGKGIKRVKPKRSTSFFSRQLSMGQGSYTVVQPTDSLEQG
jgi:hypothetical protein